MNGATPPVSFDFATWVAMFQEFSALSPAQGEAYFMRACTLCANSCSNPMYGDGNLPALLYLLTSHYAWLSCPKDANGNPAATGTPASPLVGRISSAQEGSVNVQTELEMGDDTGALQSFLSQTKYGLEYWASISQYRTATYLANPTRVVLGVLPGLWNAGGFFRRGL
jgi:hypothetical protein